MRTNNGAFQSANSERASIITNQETNIGEITIVLNDEQLRLIRSDEIESQSVHSLTAPQLEIPFLSKSIAPKAVCKICTKVLATKRSLSTHMSIMHRMDGNKPTSHECHKCCKTYRTLYNLRRHRCKTLQKD